MILKHGLLVPALKGTAIDAALIGRVLLMRADVDALERTVILIAAMILAISDAAMDAVIHVVFVKHRFTSLLSVGRIPTKIVSANKDDLCTGSTLLNMIK